MPSLKSLLEALFKLSGSQAMPSNNIVQIGVPQGDVITEYTAPANGYVCLRVTNATQATILQLETAKNRLLSLIDVENNAAFGGAYIPVRKGEVVSILARYGGAGDSYALFIPIVGAS